MQSGKNEKSVVTSEKVVVKKPLPGFLRNVWDSIVERQIFYKIFTLLFALMVFGYVYLHMSAHRNVLTYMGLMLLMVMVYVEILVIRDHLWVIEGSMREARKWRDVFFNRTTLRRQKIRKIFTVVFALAIFSYVYMKVPRVNSPVLSFMGIILMMTMLYYEILTIRDEVLIMRQSLEKYDHDAEQIKSDYDDYLAETGTDGNQEMLAKDATPANADESSKKTEA